MFYKISDFKEDWAYESQATLKILRVLTDESLGQKVNEEGRTLGRLAWHTVCALGEMTNQCGLPVNAVTEKVELPVSAKKIADEYENSSKEVVDAITKNWPDELLGEQISVYGANWKKGQILTILIRHQIHHRAQMTILMRQAGLKVPGIYGPSREEWELMKMPPLQ